MMGKDFRRFLSGSNWADIEAGACLDMIHPELGVVDPRGIIHDSDFFVRKHWLPEHLFAPEYRMLRRRSGCRYILLHLRR